MAASNSPTRVTFQGFIGVLPAIIAIVSGVGGIYLKLNNEIADLRQKTAIIEAQLSGSTQNNDRREAEIKGSILAAREDFKTAYMDLQRDILTLEARVDENAKVTRTDVEALKKSVIELEFMIQSEEAK